jgi:hypothetical protein
VIQSPVQWLLTETGPFPKSARGLEINGIDLVLQDSLMAGCITSLLDQNLAPTKRAEQLRLLEDLQSQLDGVLSRIVGDARPYFVKLSAVASTVLSGNHSVGPR